MIGTKLSHYAILDRIGVGGMSEVYKAFDPRLDRIIALKILHPNAVSDKRKRQRFIQEARAASALNHPNIITIYDIGQEDDRHYIATEYIEGQTLRQKLQSGPLPMQVALEIATQVAKAMSAAHTAGIVHRDIKPENVMIRNDGYVKVLDFGLAKLIEPATSPNVTRQSRRRQQLVKTETNMVLGTVRYMSPEQVQSLPIDHRCDIFSFGILLYEMLTGQPPFNSPKPLEIAQKIIAAETPLLSDSITGLAIEFQPILNHCLEKNPDIRYQEAQSLLKDLRRLQRRLELSQEYQTGGLPQERTDLSNLLATPTRPSLMVTYFENLTRDREFEWWRKAITELLCLRLLANPHLDIVGSEQIADLFGRSNDTLDKATVWENARYLGVKFAILGSFIALADSISLSAHLYEVETGHLITSLNVRRTRNEGLVLLVEEIAARIEHELRSALSETESFTIIDMVTNSLVALEKFTLGMEQYHEGDFAAAQKYFEESLVADSQFILVHYYLAQTAKWQYKPEYRKYLDTALQNLEKMSNLQQLLILSEEAAIKHDYISQAHLAEELVTKYPREKMGYLFLAQSYHWRAESERAFGIFQQALSLDHNLFFLQTADHFSTIFESCLDTGRFEAAEELVRKHILTNPNSWFAHYLLGIVLYYNKQYSAAQPILSRAASLNDSDSRYPELWQARICILQRQFSDAEQLLRRQLEARTGLERLIYWRDIAETIRERGRLRDWFHTLSAEKELFDSFAHLDPAFISAHWPAFLFEQVGEMPRACAEYEQTLRNLIKQEKVLGTSGKNMEGVWARVHLGRLLAACGQYERAAELAAQVKLIGRDISNQQAERLALFLLGTVEFHQGNYQAAAELLERSIWSYYNGLAIAIRMLAQCLRQLKQYERAIELLEWIQPYGTANSCNRFCSRTQLDLEMAKIYEAAGDSERAIELYYSCLQAWEMADEDFLGRQEAEAGLQFLTR